jgi:hypothetical protein
VQVLRHGDGLGRRLADGVGVRPLQAHQLALDHSVKEPPSACVICASCAGLQLDRPAVWECIPP